MLIFPGSCQTMLDSASFADRDNEIYCKQCYGKQFGPKGYGFGNASALTNTGK